VEALFFNHTASRGTMRLMGGCGVGQGETGFPQPATLDAETAYWGTMREGLVGGLNPAGQAPFL
jgi:hypothetical protein